MKFKKRKQYQRSLNHLVKILNTQIEQDDLWLGRFELRQKSANYHEWEDHSGGVLYVTFRAYDKATGYYKDYRMDYSPTFLTSFGHLWEIMNKFITEDSGVWESEPRPGKNTGFIKDYRSRRVPDEVMMKEPNWFVNYKNWERK